MPDPQLSKKKQAKEQQRCRKAVVEPVEQLVRAPVVARYVR